MNRFILDTDHLSLLYEGNPIVARNVELQPLENLAISIVSVEETLGGWYSMLHRSNDPAKLIRTYANLEASMQMLSRFPRLAFDEPALTVFRALVARRLNVGKMDLRIAATVIAADDVLVSRNQRDFGRIRELRLVDWSKA